MRSVFTIGHNDARLFLKDPSGYVWLFAVPFLFIFFFGSGSQGDDKPPTNPKPFVVIDNGDLGFMGALFIEELGDQGLVIYLPDHEEAGEVSRGIRIPADFTANILAKKPGKLELYTTEGASSQADAMLEARLLRAVISMISQLIEADSSADLGVDADSLKTLMARPDPVTLDIRFAGKKKVPSGYAQWLPGIMVMMLLMNLVLFGGLSISEERRSGVIRRLAMQPMSRFELILGKIYGRFLLALVQIAFYALGAVFVFKVPFGQSGLTLLALVLIYALGCASFGVLIGSLILDPQKVTGVGVLGGNVLAGLGGCWWPLEITPPVMQQIGQWIPTNWAMRAMQDLMIYDGGWASIRLEFGLLIGFALVSVFLSARYLRYEE